MMCISCSNCSNLGAVRDNQGALYDNQRDPVVFVPE